MNKTFFHVAGIPLGNGSTILPGNWGRIIRTYQGVNPVLFREYALEQARIAKYPGKPSRLNSVFLIEDKEEAVFYRDNFCPLGIVYEVDAAMNGVIIHRGNYNDLFPPVIPIIDLMEGVADKYWSTDPIERIEILFPGPVAVIQRHI